MKAMLRYRVMSALLLTALCPAGAWCQSWPAKPVKMIVPYAPGGGADITARVVAQILTARLGQQVLVDNRAGGGGNIATELVVKSPPDGYTIYMGTVGQVCINQHMYDKLPFDPVRDLAPITPAGLPVNVLNVHPSIPAKNVRELIALAKAQPDKLNFATGGMGASDHMATELFMSMTGTRMVHVPYKGGGPAIIDLIAGNVDLGFSTMATAIGPIKTGRLRALGVTSGKRFELLPDVPTIAEGGVKGYESVAWYGLFAPTGTPGDIIKRLNTETVAILQMEDVRKRLTELGIIPVSSTPEAFAAYVQSETARWGKLVRANGIKAQ